MHTQTLLVSFIVLVIGGSTLAAPDPSGIVHWTSTQLKAYEKTLAAKLGAGTAAVEQLGNFGNHSAVVAHRQKNGRAEMHLVQADLFVVQTGEATLLLGGEIVDQRQSSPTEIGGSSLRGAIEKTLSAGDVVHIPAKTPHQMLIRSGQQVTYLAIKVDTP
jgi:mannose-6-phosphate isomerase-like protein (cupin superfamily)